MSKVISILVLIVSALGFASAAFAQYPTYVVTNNDEQVGNTGTVFVPDRGGELSILKTLDAVNDGLDGGYFDIPRVAVESNAGCVFLSDAGTSDIAAFSRASGFNKVGNFSNPSLNGDWAGIGMVVSPDGKFLYSTYSYSNNIQAWAIGTGDNACKLTALGDPVARGGYGPIGITSDGKVLIAPETNLQDNPTVQAFTSTNGVLTPLGNPINLANESACDVGCDGAGVDSTNVVGGKALVVIANSTSSGPYFITLGIDETSGLSFLGNTPIYNVGALADVETLVFSKNAREGNGYLYVGMAGFDSFGLSGDCGFAVLSVTNGTINPTAVAFYDATTENRDATYCSNVAIAEPIVGDGGNGVGLWQNDTKDGTNVMWSYRLDATTIKPYAHLSNMTDTFVLSIASVRGNPN